MRLRLIIGKWSKERGSLALEDPAHKEVGTSKNLTLGRDKTRENNLLNGKKGSHMTNAGVNI